ncbi:unnamed protein product [Effrenium voratum]|nr:unnamed protein product [Effrenium voratum]
MSRANAGPSRGNFVLTQATSRGGSAQTFQGLLSYVEEHRPLLILFENVDSMDDKSGGPTNLDLFLSELASRGYEGQTCMTDASQFGLPARRRRVYVLLVRATCNPLLDFSKRSLTRQLETFRRLVPSCLRTAPCATKVLLGHDDEAIQAELQAREAARATGPGSGSASGSWADTHMQFAETIRVRWGQRPPASLANNPWFKTFTAREQDALPLCQQSAPTTLLRDLSQSISRMNSATLQESGRHLAPTMMPKRSRLLLGREALTLQGFPASTFVRELSQHQPLAWLQSDFPSESLMADLAGNAMALPVVLAMLQAAFAALEWQQPGALCAASETVPASAEERAQ